MKIDGMNKSDWLMLVLIVAVLFMTNFNDLQTIDYVLIVSVIAWLIMLGIRLYVVNVRNKR
jgi:L-asparagine transporter-like permease